MEPEAEKVVKELCLVCSCEVSGGSAICDSCQGRYVCLLCGEELSRLEVEAGFAVCDSCRGYYFPERRIYYRPDGLSGPAVVIKCVRKKPRRLARIETPDLWIPMGGCFDFF